MMQARAGISFKDFPFVMEKELKSALPVSIFGLLHKPK
jgi:hypothetical protein